MNQVRADKSNPSKKQMPLPTAASINKSKSIHNSMKAVFQTSFLVLLILSSYLSLTPAQASGPMLSNDKLIHGASYFLFIMMLDFSWRSGRALLAKLFFAFAYSSLLEYGQNFVPSRQMSVEDIIANGLGICLFVLIVPFLKRLNVYQLLRLV